MLLVRFASPLEEEETRLRELGICAGVGLAFST
jgi:hypothetical protein